MSEDKSIQDSDYKLLKILRVTLKIFAFGILILGIIFSIFHAPANLFSMTMFVGGIIIVVAIFYALSVIIKLLVDLHKELHVLKYKNTTIPMNTNANIKALIVWVKKLFPKEDPIVSSE